MIILDTNVLSALMMANAPPVVVGWLDQQPRNSVWTTAVTVFEIEHGLKRLPKGRRRTALEETFQRVLQKSMNRQIVPFDAKAALAAGAIAAALEAEGQSLNFRDVQIAGIAQVFKVPVAIEQCCGHDVRHDPKSRRHACHAHDLSVLRDPGWFR